MKIGFTCGAFDLFHAGHVLMLQEANNHCEYLIVGLQNDPSFDRARKNKPVQSIVERQLQLKGSKYVNEVWIYNTEKELEELLLTLPINVRILGVEYNDKEFTGKQICLDRNIEIHYNVRDHNFSSTDLRERIAQAERGKEKWMTEH